MCYCARLSVGSDENGWRGDDRNGTLMLMMTDNRALMPGRQQQQRQRRSFGSDADNFSIDSIRSAISTTLPYCTAKQKYTSGGINFRI